MSRKISDSNELASVDNTRPQKEAPLSRGLVDTYFRQMGGAELLSRDEEIALAKRIEAAQRAVLKGLCRIPMFVERIARWGHELAEGRIRVADLVDLSMADDELAGDVTGRKDENKPATPNVAYHRDGLKLQPGALEASGSANEDRDSEALANREARRASATTARLQIMTALAQEISSLGRKRLAAIARGRDLAKSSRARLQDLMSRFADETVALPLHPNRVSELIEELEHEQQMLWQTEMEPLVSVHRVGLLVLDFRNAVAEVAQRGKGLTLFFLERLVDSAAARLIVLALENRWQRGLKIIDQLVHRVVKRACTAGRKLDGDRALGINEIVDINPIGRARLRAHLFGQDGLDRVLHAGAVGADDKKIETVFADLGAKPDRFERARLANQAIDRLQFRRRREW